MLLSSKVMLVTGAGTGIGAAVCESAAREGATVLLMGRREECLKKVAARIGPAAIPVAGDAADENDVKEAVRMAVKQGGGIDSVVTCAGTVEVGSVTDTDDDAWERLLYSNLNSVFVTARACLPHLIARKGSLTIVSSIAGLEAMPQSCGYVTAKHAVIGLMRSIAMDYGPEGVRANAICPGWIKTPMADEEMAHVMARDGISLDAAYDVVTADTPLRRAGSPQEIAEICCFLASDRASIITGSVITADAGSTIVCAPTLRM